MAEPSDIFNRPSGRRLERELLDGLMERLSLRVHCVTQRECPDFYVALGDGSTIIGIEVVEFYSDRARNGSRGQEQLSNWKKVSRRIRTTLDRLGHTDIAGTFHFIFEPSDVGPDIPKVIKDLASTPDAAIEEALRAVRLMGSKPHATIAVAPASTLVGSVRTISVARLDRPAPLWWCSHLQSGSVDRSEVSDALLSVIQNKADRSKSYDWNGCREGWLLIVASGHILESMLMLDETDVVLAPTRIDVPTGTFHRILLWDKWSEVVFELWPRRARFVGWKGEFALIGISRFPPWLKEVVDYDEFE